MDTKEKILILVLIFVLGFLAFWSKTHAPENKMFKDSGAAYTKQDDAEATVVTNYIKQNITTLATNKPVLGGNWYTTSIIVDPNTKSGTVVYEDGHIQSSARFKYSYPNDVVNITEFTVE